MKGREDLDVPLKMARLAQWCEDINAAQSETKFGFLYVDQQSYEAYRPKSFKDLVASFKEYQAAHEGEPAA